ncbi:unnamed protein product [Blepharisma stoltei]|uniref:Uncharacterized protein n=1 Tax=Blepharisma stoltei TaxID=1481888 RepID=A0AAU9KJJ9_9CILI|nr:unnamed protein product [Blepharisma stoltei]
MLSADGFSCFPCFAGCFLCSSTHYYQCTACFSSYYLLNVLCDTQCPSGFNSNAITNKCDLVNSLIVDLELDDYIVLDNLLGFNVGSINTNTYPVLDVNDQKGYFLLGKVIWLAL